MNSINISNSSVSFNGLMVKGAVSSQNVKKLGDFASKIENINFIKDLEKDFEVDAVLNSDITHMSFSHKKYGILTEKQGCGSYQLENVFRDATYIIRDVKNAISKAAVDFEKKISEIDAARRGC